MAWDFTFEIHRCVPHAPQYNIIKTQMEGFREYRRLKSTDPIRRWDIEMRGKTNAERDSILSHYNFHNGGLDPFYWTPNPTFFGSDTEYVTYEDFQMDCPEGLGNIWHFYITFKEELP
jgi:hypothetical protein